ncbi:MAG TPA: hypothetical protein VJG65_02705 [Patescibacteria group bacterium]|nr:hypothetical protein [Patescibacteria group bacterium]
MSKQEDVMLGVPPGPVVVVYLDDGSTRRVQVWARQKDTFSGIILGEGEEPRQIRRGESVRCFKACNINLAQEVSRPCAHLTGDRQIDRLALVAV